MKAIVMIISFVILSISGCDLFSTRQAEDPTQPRSNLPQAFTREDLINNFIASYGSRTVYDYTNCFSDSLFTGKGFTFVATGEAASQYPSLSQGWNLNSEERYFKNIVAASQDIPINVILSNSSFSQQGDSLIYTASYSITVPFTDPNITNNYSGDLTFYIIQDNNLIYRIYYWQDFKTSDSPSWSELKGRFSN
jgi:hypothetical protein